MPRVRRFVPLIPLVAILAAWAVSYVRAPVAVVRSHGVVVARGAIYLGPATTKRAFVTVYPAEFCAGAGGPRWLPVHRARIARVWIVEGWLVALLIAAPTFWVMRGRWRLSPDPARGFDVLGADGGNR